MNPQIILGMRFPPTMSRAWKTRRQKICFGVVLRTFMFRYSSKPNGLLLSVDMTFTVEHSADASLYKVTMDFGSSWSEMGILELLSDFQANEKIDIAYLTKPNQTGTMPPCESTNQASPQPAM